MLKFTSVASITCWYGKYPWYLPYFLHSCSFNPTVDFYIITDNSSKIENKPDNVKIIYKTLDEIKATASEKLGFAVNIDYPYKLCDFKPAYGFLFPEIINGYDFWGIADIDIVYGSIRNFMTEEILKNHDIISSRHDYLTGSFCLFRNNDYINHLFMKSKDYKMIFSNPVHFCFDECNFLFEKLKSGISILEINNPIESMTYIIKKEEKLNRLKAFFDFIIVEGLPGNIEWNNGKLVYKDMYEVMFYHLIEFKTSCIERKTLKPIPLKYFFTKTQIME
ncbi:DUF6625 family protein [Flavobacterium pectinovorum]|uniref:Glycosyl transferase n=1 Tax=Flavobacterium pectinovorum TaxID=29533 RepID=A0A502EW85_9FLAO|nr:DUF6625 family protein [Flavobacterium pectinovorum]TPG41817.1 hypothetical protein EAH81_10100 [Flavobacterium pectinovorum]